MESSLAKDIQQIKNAIQGYKTILDDMICNFSSSESSIQLGSTFTPVKTGSTMSKSPFKPTTILTYYSLPNNEEEETKQEVDTKGSMHFSEIMTSDDDEVYGNIEGTPISRKEILKRHNNFLNSTPNQKTGNSTPRINNDLQINDIISPSIRNTHENEIDNILLSSDDMKMSPIIDSTKKRVHTPNNAQKLTPILKNIRLKASPMIQMALNSSSDDFEDEIKLDDDEKIDIPINTRKVNIIHPKSPTIARGMNKSPIVSPATNDSDDEYFNISPIRTNPKQTLDSSNISPILASKAASPMVLSDSDSDDEILPKYQPPEADKVEKLSEVQISPPKKESTSVSSSKIQFSKPISSINSPDPPTIESISSSLAENADFDEFLKKHPIVRNANDPSEINLSDFEESESEVQIDITESLPDENHPKEANHQMMNDLDHLTSDLDEIDKKLAKLALDDD